jgi:hypothetical protein
MSWTTVDEAAAQGPLSRASIFRRVKAGALPTYIDAEGTRWVWSVADPLAAILTELVELRALVEAQSQRETGFVFAPEVEPEPAGPTGHVEERSFVTAAPRASVRQTFRPNSPFDADDLLSRVESVQAATGLSLNKIEQAIGLGSGFMSRALAGAKRGRGAARSWAKIAAWLDGQDRLAA